MAIDLFQQLTDMPSEKLGPIVSQVLDKKAGPVSGWSVTELGRSAGPATAGIFRIAGSATTADGVQSWSAIVKVLGFPRMANRGHDPAHAERELAVYRAGLFATSESPVRTPRCYTIDSNGETDAIWMEDLSGAPQPPWLPNYYVQTARHVGEFNGRWVEPALPDWPWLSAENIHATLREPNLEKAFAQLPELQHDPMVGRALPPDIVTGLQQLWQSRFEFLDKVAKTPRSLYHGDCHTRNLFPIQTAQSGSYTVAVDWARIGIDHLGADIGKLLSREVQWLDMSIEQADGLVDPVLHAYLTGLAAAGWVGNEALVRLTYMAHFATKAATHIVTLIDLAGAHPEMHAKFDEFFGCPAEQGFERWADVLGFFLTYHARAREWAKRV